MLLLAVGSGCGDAAGGSSQKASSQETSQTVDAGNKETGETQRQDHSETIVTEPQTTKKKVSIFGKTMVSFTPGPNAGFGQTKMPGIVLGPPKGAGTMSGSLDVVSLGINGSIVLDFGEVVSDIEGPELFVFENGFFKGGNPSNPFAELAQVSVSLDGNSWTSFPCSPNYTYPVTWKTCAGKAPVLAFDAKTTLLAPETSGGDPFDIATINVSEFRYVKIDDKVGNQDDMRRAAPTAGFDLDAVGAIVVR